MRRHHLLPLLSLLLQAWCSCQAASSPESTGLYCDCHVAHSRATNIGIHCVRNGTKGTGISCNKGVTPELPDGYQYLPGYAMVKLYRTFARQGIATRVCEKDGGHLAVLPDTAAHKAVLELFAKEPGIDYAYVGVNTLQTPGVHVGVDGKPAPFLNWAQGEPNNKDGVEYCVALSRKDGMSDVNCDSNLPFLCELKLRQTIPAEYSWVEDAGRFIRVRRDKKSYDDAKKACQEEGASLAVPDTWKRAQAILRLLPADHDSYLVGLTDTEVEGDFVTEDGRHLSDMEFQMWQLGEPNNDWSGYEEDCMSLKGVGMLNDVGCQWVRNFICEIRPF